MKATESQDMRFKLFRHRPLHLLCKTALNFHAFFQWCSNEDGVANVDERFWQELADTHAAFYNHNNAVDSIK
jgi:hypothetical protein